MLQKSAAQDEALAATGQLVKLVVIICWSIWADGKDAERTHKFAQRSLKQVTHPSDVATESTQQLWDGQQLALPASGTTAPPTPKEQGKGKSKRGNRGGQKKSKDWIWFVRSGIQFSRDPKLLHAEEREHRCLFQVPEPSLQRLELPEGTLLHWLWWFQTVRRMPLPARSCRRSVSLNEDAQRCLPGALRS